MRELSNVPDTPVWKVSQVNRFTGNGVIIGCPPKAQWFSRKDGYDYTGSGTLC